TIAVWDTALGCWAAAGTESAARVVRRSVTLRIMLLISTFFERLARRFPHEYQRADHAHRGEGNRVPEPGVDIAGDGYQRKAGHGQEAADPAGADMIGQAHRGVADARG